MIALVKYGGVGYHTDFIEATQPQTLITYRKLQFAYIFPYSWAVTLPKLAILFLLLRIFVQKSFKTCCYITAGIIVSSAIANTVVACLLCDPLAAVWDSSITTARCLDFDTFYKWSPLPNVITDVMMLVLPVPFVAKMNLSIGVKVGLIMTFAAGGL